MDLQARISRREALKFGAISTTTLALASCGAVSGGNSSGPHTLQFWIWAGDSIQKSAFQAITNTFPKDFKNVKLNITTLANGDVGVAQQLSLALAAHKNIPDFLMLNCTEVPQFAEAGVLEDLGSIVEPVKSDLYVGAEQIGKYKGKYVALPWQLNSKLFYYRQDLFEKAGIDVEAINTVDDFIAAGHKFHTQFPKQYIMNMGTQPVAYLLKELLSAYPDLSMADSAGKYQLTTNPAFAECFRFLKQVHDAGIAYPIDDFTADWPAAIKNESIGGFLIAAWMKGFLPGYATTSQLGKWKAMHWPKLFSGTDQSHGSDSGGSVLVVPKQSPNKELALQYISKLRSDKQGAMAVFNATGVVPLLKGVQSQVIDSINNAKKPASMTQEQWQTLPQNFFGKDYYPTELASYDIVQNFVFDPAAIKEFTTLGQWLNKTVQNKASVEEALAGAQKDMETQIGNPYQQS
jgi:ABC-type glycerol-3-phosphate transport system substrate-binding protein